MADDPDEKRLEIRLKKGEEKMQKHAVIRVVAVEQFSSERDGLVQKQNTAQRKVDALKQSPKEHRQKYKKEAEEALQELETSQTEFISKNLV